MSGVDAELQQLKFMATEATWIGEEYRKAVSNLTTVLESGLGSMDGLFKNAFWQGRTVHFEAVDKLCTKLCQLSEGIDTSNALYQSHDEQSTADFNKVAGSPAVDVSVLRT
ncbi:hypothetical protein [Flindersiella endophytica]